MILEPNQSLTEYVAFAMFKKFKKSINLLPKYVQLKYSMILRHIQGFGLEV